MNKEEYNIEKIKKELLEKSWSMIDNSFNYKDESFSVVTEDGYKFVCKEAYIKKNKVPLFFHTNNPYTVENIKNYIRLNNIDAELLSSTYNRANVPLLWKCECGEIFQATWKAFKRGKHCCDKCGKENGIKKIMRTDKEINSILNGYGLKLIERDPHIPISKQKIGVEDKNGYKYLISWGHLLCGNDKLWKFAATNKYTIQNINKYFENTNRSDYLCVSNEYVNESTPLDILHIPCGTIFQMTIIDIQRKDVDGKSEYYIHGCPHCYPKRTESLHASILKQVFMHEHPDTILEEKSCINPNTRFIMPTDIVNHRLKIAIEVQSQYHDNENQKAKDNIKREFWINKGYSFYAPDIRDYSVLGMVQLFFPELQEIPVYVDYNFSKNSDAKLVQEYINQYYSIIEIGEKTGINDWIIRDMIYRKRVIPPSDYEEKIAKRKRIVQLELNGQYIRSFDSRADAFRQYGYDQSTLGKAVHGKIPNAYGSIWMFETEYISQV